MDKLLWKFHKCKTLHQSRIGCFWSYKAKVLVNSCKRYRPGQGGSTGFLPPTPLTQTRLINKRLLLFPKIIYQSSTDDFFRRKVGWFWTSSPVVWPQYKSCHLPPTPARLPRWARPGLASGKRTTLSTLESSQLCMALKSQTWTCAFCCNLIGVESAAVASGNMLSKAGQCWARFLPLGGVRPATSYPGLKSLIVQQTSRGYAQSATDGLQERFVIFGLDEMYI